MRAKQWLVIFFLLIESCGSKKIKPDKVQSKDSISTNQQSNSNILGEKILFFNTPDENQLTSPDYVKIFFETHDSLQAAKILVDSNWKLMRILNTKSYHYPDKKSKFIVIRREVDKQGIKLYKIRPSNFEADSFAKPNELVHLYSNYSVFELDSQSNIYIVEPKRLYQYARPFVRIIFFDTKGKREKSITYNDFSGASVCLTEKGYIIGLLTPELSSYYKGYIPSYKLIFVDFKHNIRWTRDALDNSSRLHEIKVKQNRVTVQIEQPMGCTACEWEFLKYTMQLDLTGKLLSVQITKQPQTQNINQDTLLARLARGN
jgi:hypothetical protein